MPKQTTPKLLADLAQYEPTSLAMDILEQAGFSFILGMRTPKGSTIVATSKYGYPNLRGHLRKAISEQAAAAKTE